MIEIENLSKRYGNFHAVDNLSLSIRRGEIFGFLGVNGAGKTTTIRMLVGVLKPSAGRISIGGYDLLSDPQLAKSITGYIPDRPYIYTKLTGREFLHFMADLYNVARKDAAERIPSLLREFGLVEWQDDLVESYSHGMRQRLATCAAVIHRPQVLIIDEPMVGLDPRGARLLKDTLRRYASEGMTIFLSTHSLNVAQEVADRLAIIQRGKLISVGTLSEIRQQSGKLEADLELLFLQLTEEQSLSESLSGGA
ncbi:MAG: ABC transporter ATP-binding protein [Bdellovibrionales bacterium]|nr:ABC transporter ATP-binding protein [Bdellovibrionales bacterium]